MARVAVPAQPGACSHRTTNTPIRGSRLRICSTRGRESCWSVARDRFLSESGPGPRSPRRPRPESAPSGPPGQSNGLFVVPWEPVVPRSGPRFSWRNKTLLRVASGSPSGGCQARLCAEPHLRRDESRRRPARRPGSEAPCPPDSARFTLFVCVRKTDCRPAASVVAPVRRNEACPRHRVGTNVAGRRTTSRFGPNQGLSRVEIHRVVQGSVGRASD